MAAVKDNIMVKAKIYSHSDEAILMSALKFDESDLDLNSQGLLSNPQIAVLRGQRTLYGMGTLAMMAAFIIYFRLLGLSAFSGELCFVTIMLGLLGALYLHVAFTGWFNAYQDVKKGHAEMVAGHTTMEIKSAGKGGVHYLVTVDDIEFRVDKPAFLAFKNGEPYRVFYAPNTKKILSAEWL